VAADADALHVEPREALSELLERGDVILERELVVPRASTVTTANPRAVKVEKSPWPPIRSIPAALLKLRGTTLVCGPP